MLRSLSIKNFRLFKDLEIQPLSRVNLVAGRNNTGKTALLEAIYLLLVESNDFFRFPSAFRLQDKFSNSDNYSNFWVWLQYQKDGAAKTTLEASDVAGAIYKVEIKAELPDNSSKNTGFIYTLGGKQISQPVNGGNLVADGEILGTMSVQTGGRGGGNIRTGTRPRVCIFSTHPSPPEEDASIFNQLVIKRKKNHLIELLRVLEPKLTDLQYLKVTQQPLVYAELDLPELIPLTQLGQGFNRLFRFYSEMLVAESDIVLIDEVENGLHYSVLEEVWRGIAAIAEKEDLQVFATTHSWECIEAAHEMFKSMPEYDFAFHRLQRVKGEIQAVTHDRQMIEVAAETELEIR